MKTVETIAELKNKISQYRQEGRSIGFVPTMGYLHEGHLKLISSAKSENDRVIVSIFVNPLQFGPNEDFDAYPRNLDRDRELAAEQGADLIFAPSVKEMYRGEPFATVNVHKRTNALCGKSREGHFDGVATVLTKLFHIVAPDTSYFGMKDAQQVAIVEGLIEDLYFSTELRAIETVREEDGLAKSSRNVNLTENERKEAPSIYRALSLGKQLIDEGEKDPDEVVKAVTAYLQTHTSASIDYISLLSYPSLEPVDRINGKLILAAAVKFTKARLIDNITLNHQ
ncbi:pantoate--beta-alanine ligase [Bacillus lacus]|uniref:Pantothenate synthetase n=1 Tax=Metabacillus lacus TaxID=1983721 RepID=A0A7X2LYT5_9BACI|nr:pantoate--beta-alanine ligase [Metabacillus lacus]MRX70969.1 pantoate--beta-alanine ligase [Metabacillus lacus]